MDKMVNGIPRLATYHTLKIIFPNYTYFPKDILAGFQAFCRQYAFNHTVIPIIENEVIQPGVVYINLMEDDLVTLLGKVKQTSYLVGKDIGIISYNETPWKEHILQGITTISTDFVAMGQMAAQLVRNSSNDKLNVPFRLTLRPSI